MVDALRFSAWEAASATRTLRVWPGLLSHVTGATYTADAMMTPL